MRFLIALFAAACLPALAQPTASGISADHIEDSSARIIFTASGAFNAIQILYAIAPAACTTGFTMTYAGMSTSLFFLEGMVADVTGLAPSTTYNLCVQLSNTGGAPFSTSSPYSLVTTARVLNPVLPTNTKPSFPVPSGMTRTISGALNCSDATNGMTALLAISVPGDTIKIPPSYACSSSYTLPTSSTAKTFAVSDITTSTSNIHIVAHGFADNTQVRLGAGDANSNCLPGQRLFPAESISCNLGGGWRKGREYCVDRIDADNIQLLDKTCTTRQVPGWVTFTAQTTPTNTITVASDWRTPGGLGSVDETGAASNNTILANLRVRFISTGTLPAPLNDTTEYFLLTGCTARVRPNNGGCAMGVSLTSGGAPIVLTTAGTGVHTIVDRGRGSMYIAPAPDPNGQYITITTTVSGGCPPENTRVNPSWSANMPSAIRQATPGFGSSNFVMTTAPLAFNYRFHCVRFDTSTNTQYLTTLDPQGYGALWMTKGDSENIWFDQVYMHGPGYPNRMGSGGNGGINYWDGRNTGFINSWIDGIDYWKPWCSAGAASIVGGGTTARLAATSCYSGSSVFGSVVISGNSDVVITGGSASGVGYMYLAMDGTMKVDLPTGITANCTTSISCTVINSAVPALPLSSGRRASCPLISITLTSGSVTAVGALAASGACQASDGSSEGASGFIAGNGPGPYTFENNNLDGAGLPLHWDDSGGPMLDRSGYVVTKNLLRQDQKYLTGQIGSNTLRYQNRNFFEWKGGTEIDINGNIIDNSIADFSNASVALAMTPRSGGYSADFTVRNNWWRNGAGALNSCAPIDSYSPVSAPCVRQKFSNNLITTNGDFKHTTPINGAQGQGWAFYGGSATGDLQYDHNTYWAPTGFQPGFIWWSGYPIGLMNVTNNVISRSGGADSVAGRTVLNAGIPGCVATGNFVITTCTQSHVFSNNVVVPGYSTVYSNAAPSGAVVLSTVCTEWGGIYTSNCAGSESSVWFNSTPAANYAAVKYVDPANGDFHLDPTSPLKGIGSGGSDIGIDFDTILNEAGVVRNITFTPSSTSILMNYMAPDTRACWIGISSDAGSTWSWTSDGGGAASRGTTVPGLTSSTSYVGWLLCYADQTAALGFSSDQITQRSFSTTAPSTTGPSSFRGAGIRGAFR